MLMTPTSLIKTHKIIWTNYLMYNPVVLHRPGILQARPRLHQNLHRMALPSDIHHEKLPDHRKDISCLDHDLGHRNHPGYYPAMHSYPGLMGQIHREPEMYQQGRLLVCLCGDEYHYRLCDFCLAHLSGDEVTVE